MILYESNPKFVNRSSNHAKSVQETRNDSMIQTRYNLLNHHNHHNHPNHHNHHNIHNPHNLFSILLLILHPDE